MVKKQLITQVNLTITLDKEYMITCKLSDEDSQVWDCKFPLMNLFVLIAIVNHLFLCKVIEAKTFKFNFRGTPVTVNKSTSKEQQAEILSQIAG